MIGHAGLAGNFHPSVNAGQTHAVLGRHAAGRGAERQQAQTNTDNNAFMGPPLFVASCPFG